MLIKKRKADPADRSRFKRIRGFAFPDPLPSARIGCIRFSVSSLGADISCLGADIDGSACELLGGFVGHARGSD